MEKMLTRPLSNSPTVDQVGAAFPLAELPVHAEPQRPKINPLFEFDELSPPSLGHETLALFDLDPVRVLFSGEKDPCTRPEIMADTDTCL